MASADADSVQLPADPGLLTPPSRVVTIGSFRGIPARERPGRPLSRDELVKFVKEARAPHPIHNPARPGRITPWNDTSDEEPGKYKYSSYCRLNIAFTFLQNYYFRLNMRSTECADEEAWHVVAEYATD
jgi:hypothetical protein